MNSIHYYPYASFTDNQAPLLKATVLYFDKLHILDPFRASWQNIGAIHAKEEISFLKEKKILLPIHPAEVLHKYEAEIAASIRADMNDPEFLKICEDFGKAKTWILALAKVPKAIRDDSEYQPLDQSMRKLMGDFSREMSSEAGQYQENYFEYAEAHTSYNESYDGYGDEYGNVEYRFASYPLALGESIMINHALFAGLLHAEATPITDNSFHKRVLEHKIKRAAQTPLVREVLEDRFRSPQLKQAYFSHYLLTDRAINIPALSPDIPLVEIYNYREKNQDKLKETRRRITQLSRTIKDLPLTNDFEKEVDFAMADLDQELEELGKLRNDWLKDKKVKNLLSAAGIATGAAATTLSMIFSTTPLAPIGIITAGLGMFGSAVIPGIERYIDLKTGNRDTLDNGLHYLLEWK